ncbi:hypothetical protein PHYPO_G00104980 [Pangasianodon hypophthalmus]|uniref:Protein Dr1 n=4 Tax=Siluroidei TaxID=1489793 RepID=A0A5N5PZ08_PANHP|nr:hypothetical protein PHYPO_G00104980 [Pangasianodon hypophthalmus]
MASSSGNDDDLTIPRAAINKMIKETLPNVRVANDARELVVNCCTEFIHLVSSEANEICNKSEKKTISPEHVINALESLGFGSYIAEVKDVLQECKTVALKRRKASSRLENLGIPEEELLRQQQELFAKARQQQAELAQQEWLQMQQAAQQAQLAAAASATAAQHARSSQEDDEEDDMQRADLGCKRQSYFTSEVALPYAPLLSVGQECFLNSSRDATVSNAELRSEFSVSESQESHTGVLQLNISPYHITQVCILSSFFFLRPQCLLK